MRARGPTGSGNELEDPISQPGLRLSEACDCERQTRRLECQHLLLCITCSKNDETYTRLDRLQAPSKDREHVNNVHWMLPKMGVLVSFQFSKIQLGERVGGREAKLSRRAEWGGGASGSN